MVAVLCPPVSVVWILLLMEQSPEGSGAVQALHTDLPTHRSHDVMASFCNLKIEIGQFPPHNLVLPPTWNRTCVCDTTLTHHWSIFSSPQTPGLVLQCPLTEEQTLFMTCYELSFLLIFVVLK
jgi:hypothetical protein